MCCRQEARLKMFFTALQGTLDIQGPHDPVFGGPEWQLDESTRAVGRRGIEQARAALFAYEGGPTSWRNADWSSTGSLPDPGASRRYDARDRGAADDAQRSPGSRNR